MTRLTWIILSVVLLLPVAAAAQGYKGVMAPQEGWKEPPVQKKEAPAPKTTQSAEPLTKTPAPAAQKTAPPPPPPENSAELAKAFAEVDQRHASYQKQMMAGSEAIWKKQQEELDRMIARQKKP